MQAETLTPRVAQRHQPRGERMAAAIAPDSMVAFGAGAGRLPTAMVVIAQLAEHQVVILAVGGSSPLGHPTQRCDGPGGVRGDRSLGTLSGRLLL